MRDFARDDRAKKTPRQRGSDLIAGSAGPQQRQFVRKLLIGGKFARELRQQLARARGLVFALARQRQQDLRERPEIVPVVSGPLHLRHSAGTVAMDSAEP